MDESLPITDVKRWEDEEFEWNTKYFYTVPLSIFLGKPKNLHESFQRLRAAVASKDYSVPPDGLALMEIEMFKGKVMLEIQKTNTYDANILEMERSKFFTAVHHGPIKTINKTIKSLKQHVLSNKGVNPTSTYIWDFRHGPELVGARSETYVVFCRV